MNKNIDLKCLPSAHGPNASLIVPLEKNVLLVREVTSTGSPLRARICSIIAVIFTPMDSGGAIFWSLCPN